MQACGVLAGLAAAPSSSTQAPRCAAPVLASVLFTGDNFKVTAGKEHLKTTNLRPGGLDRVGCSQCFQPLYNDVSKMHVISTFPMLFPDLQFKPQYHLCAPEVSCAGGLADIVLAGALPGVSSAWVRCRLWWTLTCGKTTCPATRGFRPCSAAGLPPALASYVV